MKNENLATNGLLVAAMFVALYVVRCSDSASQHEQDVEIGPAGSPPDATDQDVLSENGNEATVDEGRSGAIGDLRTMRAQMMAELAQVRERLNEGTRPKPQHDADQARAAELAQGLERTDRAIALAEFATDAQWRDAADTTRRATQEVRAWWNAHRNAPTAQVH
jgi:hypothetical protein